MAATGTSRRSKSGDSRTRSAGCSVRGEERSRLAEEATRTISRRFSREVVERSFLEAFHRFSAGHPTPESGATTWSESARIGQDAGRPRVKGEGVFDGGGIALQDSTGGLPLVAEESSQGLDDLGPGRRRTRRDWRVRLIASEDLRDVLVSCRP